LTTQTSPAGQPASGFHIAVKVHQRTASRALLLTTLALFGASAQPNIARGAPPAEAFSGVGAWVSVFEASVWARPERAVADMRRRGVSSLYLQTASSRPGPAVFRPDRTARFLRAAHARGMRVVAWYLPPYARPGYELRRALGAVRFQARGGDRFDAFALDIEAAPGSPGPSLRNQRLLRLSESLRRAVGPAYPLGAIIPSPYGLELPRGRRWWPRFPYRGLRRHFDAFLPMGYYTYHGEGPGAAFRDTRRNLEILRSKTGDPAVPIHIVGGESGASSSAEGRAFKSAVNRYGAIGASMYSYGQMGGEDWRAFSGLRLAPVGEPARAAGGVSATPVTHGPRHRRLVALTFDADMTYSMLDRIRAGTVRRQIDGRLFSLLRRTRTPATIFLTGLWTGEYAGFVRGLARDSLFQLENHSYDHRAWTSPCFGLPTVTRRAQKAAEVTRTQRVVKRVAGVRPRFFRFPGGCETLRDRRLVARLGLRTVGWDVDSGDAFEEHPRTIVRAVLSGVRPGSIVVAHCIGAPNTPATGAAMARIIPALRARGYRFVTLDRLLSAEVSRPHESS